NCSQSGVIPEVDVTVDGVPQALNDTGQVLNTGGVDAAVCSANANESTQWTPLGNLPCAGAELALLPTTQTHDAGQTATLHALFANGCGDPLSNVTVNFGDFAGPNAGLTLSATTDSFGSAIVSYSSTAVGTDTWLAAVTNQAGT